MKLGYFTDTHARADTPSGRTDNFRTAILAKFEEMGNIWHDNNVKTVFFGGDLFHTPDAAKGIINDVAHILQSWRVDIIAVVGSHDYFGYQMKSLRRTALGHFVEFGSIRLVGGGLEGIPDVINLGEGVYVTGTHHSYQFAEDVKHCYRERFDSEVRNTFNDTPVNKYQIQLVHGDLFNVPVLWPHILTSQVKTESDLVLSGHIHAGWPEKVLQYGKTKFVNPGSIARLENTGKQRIPMVNIIDVSYINNVMTEQIQFIPLTSAAEHPFKDKVEASEEVTNDVSTLLQLISSTHVEAIDIKAQLPEVAKKMGLSTSVVDCAFDFIEKATPNV